MLTFTKNDIAQAEFDMRAAGLFQSLVATAELYCEALGVRENDALSTLMQGLAENLQPTQGDI